jgi:poly-gamma-glutamate synthesis protein (capsule biosynthesis protein)
LVKSTGTVAIAGDVMLATTKAATLAASSPGFAAAVARLKSNDLTIGNLEMPLSNRGYRVRKHSNLRSEPDAIQGVTAMGFQVVSLANNHMMDYGPDALFDTLDTVSAAGIAFAGAGPDLDAALKPAISAVGKAKVGMLSFSSTLPIESGAGIGKPGIAPIRVGFSFEIDPNLMIEQPGTMPTVHSWTDPEDRARACECVAQLKKEVDVVVVMIHWGVPNYWLCPSQGYLATYQQVLGRALIDAGADVIVGHHSHCLHPVEIYRGKPIFYSLGNFLFEGARSWMEPESVIVELDLKRGGYRLAPLWLTPDGFPELAEGERAEAVLEKLRSMSQPFGDAIRIDNGLGSLAGV